MTYEEFKEKDKFGAFSEFMSVRNAKERNYIPKAYHGIFPDKCRCGSDNMITENRSTVMCCDPKCYIKMGFTLSQIFTNFDCINVGNATCLAVVKEKQSSLKYNSILELLAMDEKEYPVCLLGSAGYDYAVGVSKMLQTKLTFAELISKIAIPSFGTDAVVIFKDIKCSKELIEKVKEEGGSVAFLFNRSVKDKKRAFYLVEFLKDIIIAESIFFRTMRLPAIKDLPICITGTVYPDGYRMTRNEFLTYCNDLVTFNGGQRLYNIRATKAISSVEFVVADSPSTSNTYVGARERERAAKSRGVDLKVIVTADEFITILKHRLKEVSEKCNITLRENQMISNISKMTVL